MCVLLISLWKMITEPLIIFRTILPAHKNRSNYYYWTCNIASAESKPVAFLLTLGWNVLIFLTLPTFPGWLSSWPWPPWSPWPWCSMRGRGSPSSQRPSTPNCGTAGPSWPRARPRESCSGRTTSSSWSSTAWARCVAPSPGGCCFSTIR